MTVREWLESETVQRALDAAKIAWEGENGYVDTPQEAVVLAGGLMEMVIAIAGLPADMDSIAPREEVYRAILGGYDSAHDWYNAA